MNINNYIAKQFAKPSGLGGKMVTAIMNRQNNAMYTQTLAFLAPTPHDHILDIGCGNGYTLKTFAKKRPCTYTGIDISSSILAYAKRINRRFIKQGTMNFVCGYADDMPFSTASFSKVYTINTLYFWADLPKTLAEIHRVLKPKGLFINTFYTNQSLSRFSHTRLGYKRFKPDTLIAAAKQEGFSATIKPIVGGSAYCLICYKL